MADARFGFSGALVLFGGFIYFAYWDWNRPRQTENTSSESSLSNILMGDSAKQGRRTLFRSEAEMNDYQQAHVDEFKQNIGKMRGETRLVKVSYYSKGSTMYTDDKNDIKSPQDGWYYETKTDWRLPCGNSGTSTGFEFCGSSSWDEK